MEECFIGIEISITGISSVIAVIKKDKGIKIVPMFFMPSNFIGKREDAFLFNESRLTLNKCNSFIKQGSLTLMDGNVLDYNCIFYIIKLLSRHFKVKEILYDSWNSSQLADDLTRQGFKCIGISRGFRTLSEPSNELERLFSGNLIAYEYNPLLDWLLVNRKFKEDLNGNMMPNSIGMKALTMALSRINLINKDRQEEETIDKEAMLHASEKIPKKGLAINISLKDTKVFSNLIDLTKFLYENATESIREEVAKRIVTLGIDIKEHKERTL